MIIIRHHKHLRRMDRKRTRTEHLVTGSRRPFAHREILDAKGHIDKGVRLILLERRPSVRRIGVAKL